MAFLSKTWVSENIDPVINQYIRKWLEIIPISGTLSNLYLTKTKFGLNILHTYFYFMFKNFTILSLPENSNLVEEGRDLL